MRSLWRGAIAFGLVHIPIKVYAATEDRDVTFRQLHARCHTPIRYRKYCPTCDMEPNPSDIVRGYEYQTGQFVVLEDDDLEEQLPQGREKTVEVLHFVDLAEIDPVYFERSYYLEPDAGGGRAYKLLRDTLQTRRRVAIAQVTLRTRPRMAAVRVGPEGILTMQTLHYPDEIRSPQSLMNGWVNAEVRPEELEMALQLVDQRSRPFEPELYRDEYRESILQQVEARLSHPEAVVSAKSADGDGRVIDLMEALRASLQAADAEAESRRGSARHPNGKASPKTETEGSANGSSRGRARASANGSAAGATEASVNGARINGSSRADGRKARTARKAAARSNP